MKAETLNESGVAGPPAKRKSGWRIALRACGAVVLAILIAGIIAPHINAERFSNPIRRALEAWLGRKVQFQAVHFTLFSGPGFSLKDVLIQEDPRYGTEPFAYVQSLDARISWSALLTGKIRFSSLRLDDPVLNFAKHPGGGWNVLDLAHRLGSVNPDGLSFFPAFEVSDGRIDFRFGKRKTILYIQDCNFSVSPERSGRLAIHFSGWPARTDRAGMGFGHVRGTIHWYPQPRSNGDQLEARIILDPSNLSELTTLFAGHDIGIHGTVSSSAHIDGPLDALRIRGDLHIDDVHRWDLFASNGEAWSIRYLGSLDWDAHRVNLETAPEPGAKAPPVQLTMSADRFLKQPVWSIEAKLNQVPLKRALPVARRLGMPVPDSFTATGALNGAVRYSSAQGLSGALVMEHLSASVAGQPRFQTGIASATISSDHFHLDPATVQSTGAGTLEAGGDYYFSSGRVVASLDAKEFSAAALKQTLEAWFGSPQVLEPIEDGSLSGEVKYAHEDDEPASWSGAFRMSNATLKLAGVSRRLSHCSGRFRFDDSDFSLTHFAGDIGGAVINASYRYRAKAERPEYLRLQMKAVDLEEIQKDLEPALRPGSLLARLQFTRRHIPRWLARRNLEADVRIGHLTADAQDLGAMRAHLIWQGPHVQFSLLQLHPAHGVLRGAGSADLAADVPRYRFEFAASGMRWKEGLLSAQGAATTSGFGSDVAANIHILGTFKARNFELSPDDFFNMMEGNFAFSLPDGHPDLQATAISAIDDNGAWTGEAKSGDSGKLIVDLQQAGEQRRLAGTLEPAVTGDAAGAGGAGMR